MQVMGVNSLHYYYNLTRQIDPSNTDLLGPLFARTPGASAKQYLVSTYFKDLFSNGLNYGGDYKKVLRKEMISFLDPERVDLNITADIKRGLLIFCNKSVPFIDIVHSYMYLVQKNASHDVNNATVFLYLNNFLSCPQVDDNLEKARHKIWNLIITHFSYFGIFLHQWSTHLTAYQPYDAFKSNLHEYYKSSDDPTLISLDRHCIHYLANLIATDEGNALVKPLLHLVDPILVLEVDGLESIRIVKKILISKTLENTEGAAVEDLIRASISKKTRDKITAWRLDFSDSLLHLCKHFVQSIIFEYFILVIRKDRAKQIKEIEEKDSIVDPSEAFTVNLVYSEIPLDLKLKKFFVKFKEDLLDSRSWLDTANRSNKPENQSIYIRQLPHVRFMPTISQNGFSDFELASLLSYKLIKNLTRKAAFPFDPHFIHLFFFSNLIPPGFTKRNIGRTRRLTLDLIISIFPEIFEISAIAQKTDTDNQAEWGRRWKFLCLTCPTLYNLENMYFEEFEAKSLYIKYTTVEKVEESPPPPQSIIPIQAPIQVENCNHHRVHTKLHKSKKGPHKKKLKEKDYSSQHSL